MPEGDRFLTLSNKWPTRLGGIAIAFLLAFSPVAVEASRVTPMILEIKPTGRESVARIELTNDAERDIPYEVQMMRGEISPEGQLSLTSADEQFIVFPPQAIVEARTQQVFRIQYVGDEAIDRSQVYYLSIKQIPVGFEEGQNQVQVVINYNVLINVLPDGVEPEAIVRSATYVERPKDTGDVDADGNTVEGPIEKGILIDLGNDGTRYFLAGRSSWSISGKTVAGEDFQKSYTGEEMSRLVGTGVVAPGKNRIFFVPTESPLVPDSLQITVEP